VIDDISKRELLSLSAINPRRTRPRMHNGKKVNGTTPSTVVRYFVVKAKGREIAVVVIRNDPVNLVEYVQLLVSRSTRNRGSKKIGQNLNEKPKPARTPVRRLCRSLCVRYASSDSIVGRMSNCPL
jgi:hypothetical protein